MNKKSTLTSHETAQLVRLLRKVKLPAPYPVFVALCKSVPMVAVNLAVLDKDNRILLTYRTDDFYDNWHIPGSILRYGETPLDAMRRVRTEELDGMKITKPQFVSYFIEHDSRGHEVVLLFTVKAIHEPKEWKFFKLNAMPKRFLDFQNPEIKQLQKYLNSSVIKKKNA